MKTPLAALVEKKNGIVHDIEPDAQLRQAVKKMAALGIGSLLVKRGDKLVGILTERDLARRVLGGGMSLDLPVSEAMTSPVATLDIGQPLGEAMKVMHKTHCRHLPVLKDNQVVAVLGMADLVHHVTDDYDTHVRFLEAYIRS